MYYIFDDDSGKYLRITRDQLISNGKNIIKTIIKISQVERKEDATAYGSREAAQDILAELNEHGAREMMDLMVTYRRTPVELVTTEQAIELAEECGLITDKDSYKAFGAFWAMLHGEG